MAKAKGPAGKVSMKHSKKDADARKNASFAGLCGKVGSPGVGGTSDKNRAPKDAHDFDNFSGVGGKSKSTV